MCALLAVRTTKRTHTQWTGVGELCATYRLGPDVPDEEELRDGQSRVIDEAHVDAAVEEAIERAHGLGRPSLSK